MFRDTNTYPSDWDNYDPSDTSGEERYNKGNNTMAPSNLILALAGLAVESETPIGLLRHASDQKRTKRTATIRTTEKRRMAV